jgi:hypothetical protein
MPRHHSGQCCLRCLHFHNSPAYLESVFKGLTTLSSAHASVRNEDGVCEHHDIYLSADQWCKDFTPAGRDEADQPPAP